MKRKILSTLIALCIYAGGVASDRFIAKINATGPSGWVYSVNSNAPDATGDVDVDEVSGHTVSANVPSIANFTQYATNTTDLTNIEATMSGLSATADKVASGYTFIGSGGVLNTGEFNINSKMQYSRVSTSNSYTVESDGIIVSCAASVWVSTSSSTRSSITFSKNGTPYQTQYDFQDTSSNYYGNGRMAIGITSVKAGDSITTSRTNATGLQNPVAHYLFTETEVSEIGDLDASGFSIINGTSSGYQKTFSVTNGKKYLVIITGFSMGTISFTGATTNSTSNDATAPSTYNATTKAYVLTATSTSITVTITNTTGGNMSIMYMPLD